MALLSVSSLQLWQELHVVTHFGLVLFCLLFLFFLYLKLIRSGSKLNLPPSPPKLPVIGNLHQLGTHPHRSLRDLSKKYGPLMLLHLGHAPTLVVSSIEMVREIMKTHDIVFSNRPKTTAANIFSYGCTDVGFAPYGEYWRQARKVCVLEMLSLKRVQSFQSVREEEVTILIDQIRSACLDEDSVNLTHMLLAVSNNIVSRCVLGRRSEGEDGGSKFGELSRRVTIQFAAFSFGDFFPVMGWVDVLTGLILRLEATSRALDAFFNQVIEEHKMLKHDDDREDFVHILLKLQKAGTHDVELTQDNLKAILMDMFVGGTDTTSTTLEWAMAELAKNPSVMKKAQEEVRRVVGKKAMADENDINQMHYLKCIIKESLRLHTPAPLLLPRENSTGVKLGGYDIPPKTAVQINAWAIQTDSKLWDRPEEFLPERFENNPVDFKGQDFKFIPFGGGRRGCPGISFGVAAAEYVFANLLYHFNWELPGCANVKDLDMTEVCGLTVHKKLPLHLVPALYSPP